ncbi:hypothetical protein SARC_06244 [Sphaeroforma arctica JP610]|uniref:Uncharacterized protein n=1 Tax=Sphaeroforma arctica JP610 TaxID=667725 RepID=A0A0L0FZN0_9EUKA|nr:hypothetical protein SARC_06244 [Sphaeroforma arctica JP610]KNC81428.1 hypothetical protein SARC_06244 [Sphaeroforma arctica JP610]|eukprot:XP_014155330.1 hypothetical protein SARC_06244 [Sphaeroforma arctica JP610]
MHVPQGKGGYSDNDPIVDDFDDFVPPSSGPWNSVAVQNRTVTEIAAQHSPGEKGTNDWSDPNMMEMASELFEKLTAHLRDENRCCLLQLGFGFWSEFHVSGITMKPGVNFPTAEQIDTLFGIVKAHRGPLQAAVSVGVGDDERVLNDSFRADTIIGIFYDSFMKTRGSESAYETKLYIGCNSDERVYTILQ